MKEYFADVEATAINGYQTWKVKANSPEEAVALMKEGKCTFVAEELDVQDTDMMNLKVNDLYLED